METYEKLLDEAYSVLKPIKSSGERFEIPKVKGSIEGNKTIITNIMQISSYLRRNPDHMVKFLLKELATSGQIESERLVFNRKISSNAINEKVEKYTKEFVICRECGKPDTELKHENRLTSLQCLACGAKHPVRGKI